MGTVVFRNMHHEWGSQKPHHSLAEYWFSVDEYRLYILHDYKRTQLREIRKWIERSLEGEVVISEQNGNGGLSLKILMYFELEADLTAFKLVWGGPSIVGELYEER